ncbi:hypothetical protein [Bacillus changyiensis]|uniref:hypothetical protein n=1 Tax=Bacillus changyiensis TaxID=3004103 RepID=UPI0022E4427F|nr:hypothetical protein [Bacillus changyiensis]MDA1475398.1 hypothetical protein [Bacillus changyiensis]
MIIGIVLYSISLIGLLVSFKKSKENTYVSLKKAWNTFQKLLPEILFIMLLVGVSLAVLTPELISKLLGQQSGFLGVIIAMIIGSLALIPSFVVFPLGETLLNNGAGLTQVAMFVAALMSVGLVSLPMERKMFGPMFAYARNGAALMMCILFTVIIWMVY